MTHDTSGAEVRKHTDTDAVVCHIHNSVKLKWRGQSHDQSQARGLLFGGTDYSGRPKKTRSTVQPACLQIVVRCQCLWWGASLCTLFDLLSDSVATVQKTKFWLLWVLTMESRTKAYWVSKVRWTKSVINNQHQILIHMFSSTKFIMFILCCHVSPNRNIRISNQFTSIEQSSEIVNNMERDRLYKCIFLFSNTVKWQSYILLNAEFFLQILWYFLIFKKCVLH